MKRTIGQKCQLPMLTECASIGSLDFLAHKGQPMQRLHSLLNIWGTLLLAGIAGSTSAQVLPAITIPVAIERSSGTSIDGKSVVASAIADAGWIVPSVVADLISAAIALARDRSGAPTDAVRTTAIELTFKEADIALRVAGPYEAAALKFTEKLILGDHDNQQVLEMAGSCYSLSLSETMLATGLIPNRIAICSLDTTQLLDAMVSAETGFSASQAVQNGIVAAALNAVGYTYADMEPSVVTTQKRSYQPGERMLDYLVACYVYDQEQASFVSYNNCPIEIRWNIEAGSGSHAHGGLRPRGKVQLPAQGTLKSTQGYGVAPASAGEVTPPVQGNSVISTKTAANDNRLTYSYIAPESSGTTQTFISGFQGTIYSPLTIRSDIIVWIAGLYGRGGYVGQNGARWSMKPNSAPAHEEKNYYATQALLGRLDNVANSYEYVYRIYSGLGTQGIFINDMSLPSGGLFDIEETYKPRHAAHRRGEAADIGINNHGYTELQVQIIAGFIDLNGLMQPETPASSRTCPIPTDINRPHRCSATHFHVEVDEAQIRNDENAYIE